jgi:ketosteroid isomerase-like protein
MKLFPIGLALAVSAMTQAAPPPTPTPVATAPLAAAAPRSAEVRPLPTPVPEAVVARTVEVLRGAELMLDGDELNSHLAASFTVIEDGARTAGRFAYVESLRSMRRRGAHVRSLSFDDERVDVYGASAVVTYNLHKSWTDGGRRSSRSGWSTDVFERREDGAWLLVHRHRP